MYGTSRIGLVMVVLMAAAPGAAQAPGDCAPGELYEVDFGIQGLRANQMEFSVGTVDGVRVRAVSFGSEPTVTAVREGGPAEGRLRAGDVITAIDGRLITTRAAGERWSSVEAGERVVLAVRRDGREERVGLTAGERCSRPSPAPPAPAAVAAPGAPPVPVPAAARGAARGVGAATAVGAPRPPSTPRPFGAPPAPAAPPAPSALPDGWFGLSMRCTDCRLSAGQDADGPQFSFSASPEVQAVEPGTPADEAGLQAGDLLVGIDGMALTSEAGGRAFARVEPGQTVRMSIRRGARAFTVSMRAVAREGRSGAPQILLNRAGAYSTLTTPAFGGSMLADRAGSPVARTLRYSGTVGNAVVEVRGSPSVVVSEVRPGGDVIIRVGETEIRVSAPPGGG